MLSAAVCVFVWEQMLPSDLSEVLQGARSVSISIHAPDSLRASRLVLQAEEIESPVLVMLAGLCESESLRASGTFIRKAVISCLSRQAAIVAS